MINGRQMIFNGDRDRITNIIGTDDQHQNGR